ncbi:hypothetical protein D3C76_957950 [compost metagenome]
MNIGKGVFRFIQQNQQQRNPQAGAGQRQQQGIDFTARRERQGVGHAQAHQPEIADEETDGGAAEDVFRPFAEARVVGDQRQPRERHGNGDVETHGERHRTVTGLGPQCGQVSLGEQVPGQPDTRGQQQPDAPFAQDLAHESQRTADREQGRQCAEEQRPQHGIGQQATFVEGLRAQQAGSIAHDDDFERTPADQLQQVQYRRQACAFGAEAEFERSHRRQAGVATDHADRRQQQNADQGAKKNCQQRTGQAKARREQCTSLQDHQADAEGEPQGKQIAAAEDTFVGRHRDIGGVSAGLNAQGCYLRGICFVIESFAV